MTSNLGAVYLNDMADGPVDRQTKGLVMGAIQSHFPPEFINRVDEIIIYRPLSKKDMLKIVDLRLKEVQGRLQDRKVTLDVDNEAKNYLMSIGYSPQYGARPLNRAIQSDLLNPLSIMLLSGQIQDGETARIRFDGPRNRLYVVPNNVSNSNQDWMEVDPEDDQIEIEEME